MRGANELTRPTLAQSLILPSDDAADGQARRNSEYRLQQIVDDWSYYVGGRPILIVQNIEDARRKLLQAMSVADREPVLLPANATHPLVEVVKQSGASPSFGELDQNLQLSSCQPFRIAWLQPPLGLPTECKISTEITVLDHSDSVPLGLSAASATSWQADVTLFGLHLSSDPKIAGALLIFNNDLLHARFLAESIEVEPIIYTRAAKQLIRVRTIVPRQVSGLKMVSTGLQAAAGLPVPPVLDGVALAHGVPVRIPDEGSPSTVWTYARGENTPVEWLPNLRTIHYGAISIHHASTTHLEHWLMVPVSPDNDEETNKQTVLGIVKTAEYMGLRWRTDPARAAQYGALLDTMYGSGHDAYRPAFAIDAQSPTEAVIYAEELLEPSCRI